MIATIVRESNDIVTQCPAREGSPIFLPQAHSTLALQHPPVIVTLMADPEEVPSYALIGIINGVKFTEASRSYDRPRYGIDDSQSLNLSPYNPMRSNPAQRPRLFR